MAPSVVVVSLATLLQLGAVAGQGLGGIFKSLVSDVTSAVESVTSDVVSDVSGVTSTLASDVSGVTSTLASDFSGVTATAASIFSGVTSTAASELQTIASDLGGVESSITKQLATALSVFNPSTTVPSSEILPSETPTSDTGVLDFDHSLINTLLFNIHLDSILIPVTCLNCSTYGHMEFSATDLHWDDNIIDDIVNKNSGLSGGLLQATTPDGLSGIIDIQVSSPPYFIYTIPLAEFPIVGFLLPDVGFAGVNATISIVLSASMQKQANVSFGFDWSIPAGSTFTIDLADLSNSSAKGFSTDDGFQFALLPVHVDVPGLNFAVAATLFFTISVGMSILDDSVVASVGTELRFPVTVKETQLSAEYVDDKCDALDAGNTTIPIVEPGQVNYTDTSPAIVNNLVGNYTSITDSVGVQLDIFARDGLELAHFGGHVFGFNYIKYWTLMTESWPLPTACIDNHLDSAATQTAATQTPTSTQIPTAVTAGMKKANNTNLLAPTAFTFPSPVQTGVTPTFSAGNFSSLYTAPTGSRATLAGGLRQPFHSGNTSSILATRTLQSGLSGSKTTLSALTSVVRQSSPSQSEVSSNANVPSLSQIYSSTSASASASTLRTANERQGSQGIEDSSSTLVAATSAWSGSSVVERTVERTVYMTVTEKSSATPTHTFWQTVTRQAVDGGHLPPYGSGVTTVYRTVKDSSCSSAN